MIILLEYLLKNAVFETYLGDQGIIFPINNLWFAILVISTVFVAIAGYLANDIADIAIDKINRPNRVLSLGKISVSQAKAMQWFFEAGGIILGGAVAVYVGNIGLVAIHAFIIIVLRAYANTLKCKGLIGNIAVAFSTAMLVVLIWVFTLFALHKFESNAAYDFSMINLIILFYVGFAFWFTLIREIVKDLEDLKGDRECGCKTLAVRIPLQKLKNWLMILSAIGINGILLFQWMLYQQLPAGISAVKGETLFMANFVSLIVVLLLNVIPKLVTANSSIDFHKIGNMLKIIMVAGILQMIFLLF
jgi:4-hydroxybenzoate polyprenyltransferase